MAVTGAIFEKLIFGGVDSSLYGIYITGEAVYNAPKRAVEMVSVPGRNGAVAIDQGYWENITVTYPAGTFADDQTDFADAVSAFRNALASQIGYQRLEDTYHPDEYRMAMFVDGVEVTPANRSEAGQFSISFNCKPQRWLKSGETAIAVSDGDTVTNPTLYGASPLLVVDGYGVINLGSDSLEVYSKELGNIPLNAGESFAGNPDIHYRFDGTVELNTTNMNPGDIITLGAITLVDEYKSPSWSPTSEITIVDSTHLNGANLSWSIAGLVATKTLSIPAGLVLTYGTAWSQTYYATLRFGPSGGGYSEKAFGFWTLAFDGADTISFRAKCEHFESNVSVSFGEISGYSSTIVNDTLYLDLDIGEAYWIQSGQVVDANNSVALGSDLPVLEPGANTITMDNTITNLEITPRWWQL